MLDRLFHLRDHGTTARTEVTAGITTFLTMAYIVFVNPTILADAGMPRGAVFVATCLVAALGSALMGLLANYPIAVAPGMGLNAYFTYVVVLGMGMRWQAALGAVFVSGCLFLLVTMFGLREALLKGIPSALRAGTTAGIGLFLALIAMKSSGIVTGSPTTLVTLGDLHDPKVLLAVLGFFVMVTLDRRKVRGAILIGIALVTGLSFVVDPRPFGGVFSAPPSLAPTFLQLEIREALSSGIVKVVLVFFLVEIFDATGTLMAVVKRAGLLHEGAMPRMNRALVADSASIFMGSLLGTSSSTAYIESAAGVQAGGRTGLTAMTVSSLFVACLFVAPLAGAVPPYATAPALLFVGSQMLRELSDLEWDDTTEAVPAALTALAMPFTYSIANGLAFGFVSYAALKGSTGRFRQVPWAVWVVAALFIVKFAFIGGH